MTEQWPPAPPPSPGGPAYVPGWAPVGPGYGPPGYPPPGWPGGWRPTNTTAVLALVFAFVFAPAGLVLGIVARRQIRRTGEAGEGLALAGAIVGGIGTALFALGVLFYVIVFVSLTSSGF